MHRYAENGAIERSDRSQGRPSALLVWTVQHGLELTLATCAELQETHISAATMPTVTLPPKENALFKRILVSGDFKRTLKDATLEIQRGCEVLGV